MSDYQPIRIAYRHFFKSKALCDNWSGAASTSPALFGCDHRVGLRGLGEIGRFEFAPCSVADVKYFDLLLFRKYTENHTIDVRLAAVEQVPEKVPVTRDRTTVWPFLQAQNGLLEAPVPFQGSAGMPSVDFLVQVGKVALCAGS